MAIKEQDKVFYEELANGDKVINLPVTRANNVEGLGRSASTTYVVGDVVYVDNNKKVALKCIQEGATSSNELDVSNAEVGSNVNDGSVVWEVVPRFGGGTSGGWDGQLTGFVELLRRDFITDEAEGSLQYDFSLLPTDITPKYIFISAYNEMGTLDINLRVGLGHLSDEFLIEGNAVSTEGNVACVWLPFVKPEDADRAFLLTILNGNAKTLSFEAKAYF